MRCLPVFCLLLTLPVVAAELDGHYQATLDDQPTELILRSQEQQVQGEYVEGTHLRLHLSGSFDGTLLQVQISDPETGQILANMNANYADGMLNASLAARNPATGQPLLREALFQRTGPAPPPADPHQDPALVGTWVYEQMTNSTGLEYASLSTITTLRIRADGSIAQWRRSVAGGSEWSYDRPGELQYRGHWRSDDGLLLVQLQGASDYQPAARYRFSAPYLITESNTGRMTWQRR